MQGPLPESLSRSWIWGRRIALAGESRAFLMQTDYYRMSRMGCSLAPFSSRL